MKSHNTAVVIIPPESVWPPIQSIRQQHDSKIRRWMPHITLIYPFCPLAEFPVMADLIAEQVANVEPFRVTMSSFDSFTHAKGRCTVWLKPEPELPLLDLHAAVWTAVSCDEDFEPRLGRFTPHLSVGQVRGKQKRDRLVAELQASWTPIELEVTAVHLIARDDPPNDVFRIERTVRLGAARNMKTDNARWLLVLQSKMAKVNGVEPLIVVAKHQFQMVFSPFLGVPEMGYEIPGSGWAKLLMHRGAS